MRTKEEQILEKEQELGRFLQEKCVDGNIDKLKEPKDLVEYYQLHSELSKLSSDKIENMNSKEKKFLKENIKETAKLTLKIGYKEYSFEFPVEQLYQLKGASNFDVLQLYSDELLKMFYTSKYNPYKNKKVFFVYCVENKGDSLWYYIDAENEEEAKQKAMDNPEFIRHLPFQSIIESNLTKDYKPEEVGVVKFFEGDDR